MTINLLRARVESGAATLDVTEGVSPSWRTDINLTKLDMGYPDVCVLGQIFGHYTTGADALGFEPYADVERTHIDLGFMPDVGDFESFDLTEAWREYLQETL